MGFGGLALSRVGRSLAGVDDAGAAPSQVYSRREGEAARKAAFGCSASRSSTCSCSSPCCSSSMGSACCGAGRDAGDDAASDRSEGPAIVLHRGAGSAAAARSIALALVLGGLVRAVLHRHARQARRQRREPAAVMRRAPRPPRRRNGAIAAPHSRCRCVRSSSAWSARPMRPCRSTTVLPGHRLRRHAAASRRRRAGGRATEITVRFDANVAPGLAGASSRSSRRSRSSSARPRRVFYKVTNTRRARVTGIASFNVAPEQRAPISTRSSASASTSRRWRRARRSRCRWCSSSIPRSPTTAMLRRRSRDHAVLHLLPAQGSRKARRRG